MSSVLAIVSKKVFEQQAGGSGLGDTLALDRYASTHRALQPLAAGGSLYCVTVRPGDNLWLVAVLVDPRGDDQGWHAAPNTTPITEVTSLIAKLRFASGKGLNAKPGRLGMSLQTPRELSEADVALLDQALGQRPKAEQPTPRATRKRAAARMVAPDDPDLARATAALQRHDRAAALDALLDAWARHRQPELAGLVEQLGADISRSLPPIAGDKAALTDAWVEVAQRGRAIDIDRLLDALERASAKQLRALLPSLLAFKPDPRTSRLAKLLERYTSSGATPALTQALNVLAHGRDPRLKRELGRYKKTDRSWLEGVYNKARKTGEGLVAPPPLGEADRRAIATIQAALEQLATSPPADADSLLAPAPISGIAQTGAALLQAVLDDPDDDSRRLVYADWLLERGDPRGELIQLQYKELDGGLSAKEATRVRALLRENASRWIGTLGLVASELRFERGFLAGCCVSIKTEKQRETVDDPHWATVGRLAFATEDFGSTVIESPLLLEKGRLSSLEVLEHVSARTLVRWLSRTTPPRLQELRMRISDPTRDGGAGGGANDIAHWRALCAKPPETLRRLWIEPERVSDNWSLSAGYDWLYASALGRQLEQLTIGWDDEIPPVPWADRVFDRLPGLKQLRLHGARDHQFERKDAELLATIDRRPRGFCIRIELIRPFDGDVVRYRIEAALEQFFSNLPRPELPIDRLELGFDRRASKAEQARLRRSMKHFARQRLLRRELASVTLLPDGPL